MNITTAPSTEEWRPIPGWLGYEASSLGRVKSINRTIEGIDGIAQRFKGKILRIIPDEDGYSQVALCQGGKPTTRKVHHLVLLTFGFDRPAGAECRHLNGDRSDNHLSNLKWGTSQENAEDQLMHGTRMQGSAHPNSKLCEQDIPRIREAFLFGCAVTLLTSVYGVSGATIWDVIKQKTWLHVTGEIE